MWFIITWFGVGNNVGSQTNGVSLLSMTCSKCGGKTGGHCLCLPLEDTGGFGGGISCPNPSEKDLQKYNTNANYRNCSLKFKSKIF